MWKQNRRIELARNALYNMAAMENNGFAYDIGRTLSEEEIAGLSLTPPENIRDCNARITGMFFQRR